MTPVPSPHPSGHFFDIDLPSPIGRLLELRSSASESVVRSVGLSSTQQLMARPGALEDDLWESCGSPGAPDLILLTGSAGSGKTATIGHLLARAREEQDDRFGQALADATHADSPDEEQAERLSLFFAPFADTQPRPGGPTRLIAINTGMVMKFFSDLSRSNPNHQLRELEALLKQRLGLPGTPVSNVETWLHEAVLVVNLDLRPTAGQPGDLFDSVLLRLDPTDIDGVLEGTPRCATCRVVDWCWPMANAATISSQTGRTALNRAAGTVSMRRGRELPPRALWDVAADMALSGLVTIPGEDPCARIAQVAVEEDHAALLDGLACHGALDRTTPGTLLDEISRADPTYKPTQPVHDLLSTAGLTPGDDARKLIAWLSPERDPHPAVQNAASLLANEIATQAPRSLARAAWLGGEINAPSEASDTFARALQAQSVRATADTPGEDGDVLLDVLEDINEGLAAGFGIRSGVETFYPTEAPGPRFTDVFVRTDLLDEGGLWTAEEGDAARHRNPSGALLVGYRELALALRIGEIRVPVDYPLWELLQQARQGTAPSTVDLDRYLALRRAMEAIGREAGKDRRLPLLVLKRATGRRFRVAPYGPTSLRATEVE